MFHSLSKFTGKHVLALALVGGLSLGTGGTAAGAQASSTGQTSAHTMTATLSATSAGSAGVATTAGVRTCAPTGASSQAPTRQSQVLPLTPALAPVLPAASQPMDLFVALACANASVKQVLSSAGVAESTDNAGQLAYALDLGHVMAKTLPQATVTTHTTTTVAHVTTTAHTASKSSGTHTSTPAHTTYTSAPAYNSYSSAPAGIGPWTPVAGHPSYGVGDFSGDPYAGAYGTCTWWAWYERQGEPLMRLGNAGAWAANAPRFGLSVSAAPVVGATAVFAPGVQGAGSDGHVAHVEAVLGGGWFIISEMNFYWNNGGFGRVDYRYVHTGAGVSFIL